MNKKEIIGSLESFEASFRSCGPKTKIGKKLINNQNHRGTIVVELKDINVKKFHDFLINKKGSKVKVKMVLE